MTKERFDHLLTEQLHNLVGGRKEREEKLLNSSAYNAIASQLDNPSIKQKIKQEDSPAIIYTIAQSIYENFLKEEGSL